MSTFFLNSRQFNSEARQIRGLILSKLESFYDDQILYHIAHRPVE